MVGGGDIGFNDSVTFLDHHWRRRKKRGRPPSSATDSGVRGILEVGKVHRVISF